MLDFYLFLVCSVATILIGYYAFEYKDKKYINDWKKEVSGSEMEIKQAIDIIKETKGRSPESYEELEKIIFSNARKNLQKVLEEESDYNFVPYQLKINQCNFIFTTL